MMSKIITCPITKPVLDISDTQESQSNILCKLDTNRRWILFRIFAALWTILTTLFSVWYFSYDGKLQYFLAFFTNLTLVAQCIYFMCSALLTSRPCFKRCRKQQHDEPTLTRPLSADIGEDEPSYSETGCGMRPFFQFTKLLLTISLPCSALVSVVYWLTLFGGRFRTASQATYYVSSHGLIFVLQLIDFSASKYQLNLKSGLIWLMVLGLFGMAWTFAFEALKLTNPYNGKRSLYPIINWGENPVWALIWCVASIGFVLVCFCILVCTKNVLLTSYEMREQDNETTDYQTSPDNTLEIEVEEVEIEVVSPVTAPIPQPPPQFTRTESTPL